MSCSAQKFLVAGHIASWKNTPQLISGQIIRAITILAVFCPCALVLAMPTAIRQPIGIAAKRGFLVCEGDAFKLLACAIATAFDRTGSLACGTAEVVSVECTAECYETGNFTG